MQRKFVFLLLIVLILFTHPLISKEKPKSSTTVIFIAHKDVPMDSITKKDLQKILLGKKKKWADNTNIELVLPDDDEILKIVLKSVKKSLFQFNNTWKKLIFTGKRKAPVKLKNEKEIIEFVKKTPGAFSFIVKTENPDKDVKIIKISEK